MNFELSLTNHIYLQKFQSYFKKQKDVVITFSIFKIKLYMYRYATIAKSWWLHFWRLSIRNDELIGIYFITIARSLVAASENWFMPLLQSTFRHISIGLDFLERLEFTMLCIVFCNFGVFMQSKFLDIFNKNARAKDEWAQIDCTGLRYLSTAGSGQVLCVCWIRVCTAAEWENRIAFSSLGNCLKGLAQSAHRNAI